MDTMLPWVILLPQRKAALENANEGAKGQLKQQSAKKTGKQVRKVQK